MYGNMPFIFKDIKNTLVLGILTKLRKATINFIMPVCPSVRLEQFDPHSTDFHEI
jgi:hypothetical protein